MKIYRANIIYTPTPGKLEIIPHGYIVVKSNGLVDGIYKELPENMDWRRQVMDFGDKILIPAFNDLHVHAPQYRNMGLALDLELLPWLNTYTFPEETKYADPDYARRLYRRFVHELWMQGTMRSAVFATIHPEATRILADLFIQAGMGAYVGLVGMNRNSPDTLQNTTAEVIDGMRMLKAHLDEHGDGLVQPIITPRFVPSCSDKMLTALGEYAKETGLPVQSHLSENRSEINWVKELEPDTTCYGGAYDKYGLFGQTPTLMAHCCYTDGEELELMRKNGVYVVHCPMSNSNLSSGMAPIRRFLNAGINVALGTDVSAGHHMSMLRVMQYAIQVSKLNYAQTKGEMSFLSLSEVFYLATKGGGSFFGKVGSFEPGYEFDALLIDDTYLNYDHYTLEQRLERYIYLGDDRDIKRRFCRGVELTEPVMD